MAEAGHDVGDSTEPEELGRHRRRKNVVRVDDSDEETPVPKKTTKRGILVFTLIFFFPIDWPFIIAASQVIEKSPPNFIHPTIPTTLAGLNALRNGISLQSEAETYDQEFDYISSPSPPGNQLTAAIGQPATAFMEQSATVSIPQPSTTAIPQRTTAPISQMFARKSACAEINRVDNRCSCGSNSDRKCF